MPEMLMVNPRKRRRHPRRRSTSRTLVRQSNPRRRRVSTRTVRRTRRRRNPIRRKGLMSIITTTVLPSATAAGGALALDVIWGFAPIPETLKAGPFRHVVKAAGAIGLGMLAEMLVKKQTADLFTTGALTVVIHNAMREGMARFMPNVALGEYLSGEQYENMGYYGSGQNPTMGEYLSYDQGQGSGFGLNTNDYDYNTL